MKLAQSIIYDATYEVIEKLNKRGLLLDLTDDDHINLFVPLLCEYIAEFEPIKSNIAEQAVLAIRENSGFFELDYIMNDIFFVIENDLIKDIEKSMIQIYKNEFKDFNLEDDYLSRANDMKKELGQ